jgi:predicted PurR-regulated permease PerM
MLVSNLSAIVMQFFLMLFVLFFLLRDKDTIFEAILHLIPLSSSQERQILVRIETVAKSVFLGTFVTGIVQGFAGGIAFSIANLPGLFWGTVMAFASLIPVVGTALIWVPASVYLFLSGRWGYGIFMVLWCSIIVGMSDNFVRPLFMKGSGSNMSMLLIFLAILGGLNYFGLMGLLYGPLLIGLTIVLLYMYSLEFEAFLTQQDKN